MCLDEIKLCLRGVKTNHKVHKVAKLVSHNFVPCSLEANDMKAYIQTDTNGDYYNVNAFVAAVGFHSLGFEVIKYKNSDEINDQDASAIVVGGVGMVRKRLTNLGIERADEIEYPESLRSYLNRKVWKSTLNEIIRKEQTNLFIKPVETKLFQGKVISEFKDFIGLHFDQEVEVWCSDVVNVVTEWRCFVRYGELFDVRYYKGAWNSQLNTELVKQAISEYIDQPAAFCLDFGVDEAGKHYLIEVNDGHSLGSYGMGAISYAKLLSARWSELTGTEDALHF